MVINSTNEIHKVKIQESSVTLSVSGKIKPFPKMVYITDTFMLQISE